MLCIEKPDVISDTTLKHVLEQADVLLHASFASSNGVWGNFGDTWSFEWKEAGKNYTLWHLCNVDNIPIDQLKPFRDLKTWVNHQWLAQIPDADVLDHYIIRGRPYTILGGAAKSSWCKTWALQNSKAFKLDSDLKTFLSTYRNLPWERSCRKNPLSRSFIPNKWFESRGMSQLCSMRSYYQNRDPVHACGIIESHCYDPRSDRWNCWMGCILSSYSRPMAILRTQVPGDDLSKWRPAKRKSAFINPDDLAETLRRRADMLQNPAGEQAEHKVDELVRINYAGNLQEFRLDVKKKWNQRRSNVLLPIDTSGRDGYLNSSPYVNGSRPKSIGQTEAERREKFAGIFGLGSIFPLSTDQYYGRDSKRSSEYYSPVWGRVVVFSYLNEGSYVDGVRSKTKGEKLADTRAKFGPLLEVGCFFGGDPYSERGGDSPWDYWAFWSGISCKIPSYIDLNPSTAA